MRPDENKAKPVDASDLENLIKEAAGTDSVEEQVAASLTKAATDAAETNLMDDDAEKKAPGKKLSESTVQQFVKLANKVSEHQQNFKDSPKGRLGKLVEKHASIVGYLCKSGPKIDFVRVLSDKVYTVGEEKRLNAAKYEMKLRNSAPSKPAAVIVKYPLEVIHQINAIKTAEANNTPVSATMSEVIDTLAGTLSGDGDHSKVYAITTLSVKDTVGLHSWVTGNGCSFIRENRALFVPYHKIRNRKDSAPILDSRDSYEGHSAYDKTGGNPGIACSIVTRKKKFDSALEAERKYLTQDKSQIKIDSLSDLDLVSRYTHTGRNSWVAPGNYIAEKEYITLDLNDASIFKGDGTAKYSKLYFDKQFKDGAPKTPAKATESCILQPVDSQKNFISITNGVYSAEPFRANTAYWNTASVNHWYNVDTNKVAMEVITGKNIKLAAKELIERTNSSDETKTVIRYVTESISDAPDAPRPFKNSIPDAIKNALGAQLNDFTYADFTKGLTVRSSSGGSNASLVREYILPGQTLEAAKKALGFAG